MQWTHREKDGVQYYSSGSAAQLFSLSPTIGVSDRMLIIGSDPALIEGAMERVATPVVPDGRVVLLFDSAVRVVDHGQLRFLAYPLPEAV